MHARFEPKQLFSALGLGKGFFCRVAFKGRRQSFKASALWWASLLKNGGAVAFPFKPLLIVLELILAGPIAALIVGGDIGAFQLTNSAWVAAIISSILVVAWLLLRRSWKLADKVIRFFEPLKLHELAVRQPSLLCTFSSCSPRGMFKPPRHLSFAR